MREAAEAAARHDVVLDILVELDVGGRRCGVAPGEAVRIAETVRTQQHPAFRRHRSAYHGSA